MQTLVLRLFRRKERPSFQYESNDVKIMALVDSGAETPVWCAGETEFLAAYPDAVRQAWNTDIRGFGKMAENGAVYAIPQFELTDGNSTYRIVNLLVAVCSHPQIGYDFVLSETMFSKTNTYHNRIGEKYLKFYFEKDQYNCAVKHGLGTFSIVTFAQDET